jgi:dTMP kinase
MGPRIDDAGLEPLDSGDKAVYGIPLPYAVDAHTLTVVRECFSRKLAMNKMVAIEGLDGSGKSTQIELLTKHLGSKNVEFKLLHFPRTDCPIYGEMIARFLRGEFGDVNGVNPYFVALLYAGDRQGARAVIEDWLSRGCLVIVDRYVYSNVAFQCAKVRTPSEKKRLRDWLLALEYDYNKIPSPGVSIYLHVPFNHIIGRLAGKRTGSDRRYLNGEQDIHEASIELQKRVEEEYLELARVFRDLRIVDCAAGDNKMRPPESITSEILGILVAEGIIAA